MREIVTLQCTECKERNYSTTKNKKTTTGRLEFKKFCPRSLIPALLRFLVRLVLPAVVAKLLELQTTRGRLLVLRRRVVPVLALSALQCHDFPHFSILPDSELRRVFAGPEGSGNQGLGFSFE